MSRKCRSVWRAMRREHPVDLFTGTCRSKKDTTRIRQVLAALNKNAQAKAEDNGSDSE